ncbi:MAG: Ppx/GppA family phosphatase [Candidatus Latescibacteria bacterium]|nr:Ppx/GppA family phosphatase [Candidatus Latescibacterota bacterium]
MSHSPEPIQAVIDLGTHTALMVTGRRLADGKMEVLDDAHAIARLGKGVDAQRRISAETMDRVCRLLAQYRERALGLGAERVRAFGTSALRDAANKAEFIARVRQDAGLELVEVSGSEEAGLTFRGAAFGLQLPPRYAVIDIGGGSTELALGSGLEVEQSVSVDVGAVRVTERCFPQLPPTPDQVARATDMIGAALSRLFPYPPDLPLVGVAGTVTTLGAIDLGVPRFNAEELNGHFLSLTQVEEWSAQLLSLPVDEIRLIPQVHEQRADIIGAGALILRLALAHLGCPGLTVSTRGIRYGLLLRELAAD